MAPNSESPPSTPTIKEEDNDLQPVAQGRKKSSKADPKKTKKRNLVRWDDDLDKQVLLTLQWACNEVGIKIPWELVAKTIGNGVSEGAIVQHLSKLRGKMIVAKMEVPPPLKRGSVAKEPSKLYATSNGKKLAAPVFKKNPWTPTPVKEKKSATPKSQVDTKITSSAKSKSKRRRPDLDDSDDDEGFDVLGDDSDEEYGTAKKKVRTSRAKPKETKTNKAKLYAADVEDISKDIMATFDDGGPATRTRHVKQDFTGLEQNLTDEEEDEDGDSDVGGLEEYEMSLVALPQTLEDEGSISPSTVVSSSKVNVANFNQGGLLNMRQIGGSSGFKANGMMPPYQQATMSTHTGLMTPQPSRQASNTSYNQSMTNTPLPMSFNQGAGQEFGQDFASTSYLIDGNDYPTANNGVAGFMSPLNGDLGFGNGTDPYAEAAYGDGYGYPMTDNTMFDEFKF